MFNYTYSLSNILKLQVIVQWKSQDLKQNKKTSRWQYSK